MQTLSGNALGDFLRASRANVDPHEAGLAGGRGSLQAIEPQFDVYEKE